MDCPKCGTWNPDDKTRCWRCGADLPKLPERKKERRQGSQTWVWIAAGLIFVVMTLLRCGVLRRVGDQVGLILKAMDAATM